MKANQADYSVRRMCGLLGVSPSGYYACLSRGPSGREQADRALRDRIVDIPMFGLGAPTGCLVSTPSWRPRVWPLVGKRVARLMRQARIQGVHRRRKVCDY